MHIANHHNCVLDMDDDETNKFTKCRFYISGDRMHDYDYKSLKTK